jgi:hypothetical protein
MALMESSLWRSGWNNILLFSPQSLHWWRPSQGGVRMTDQILLIFLEIISNCCPMIFSRSKIAIFTLLKFCTWADTSCRRISSIYRNIKNQSKWIQFFSGLWGYWRFPCGFFCLYV